MMTIPPVPPVPPTDPASRDHGVAPRLPSWWRSNRWALAALAALLPAVGFGIGWHEWDGWFGHGARPITPVMAEAEETVDLAGAEWGPVRSGELTDLQGLDVPAGATVIGVIVPVAPGADGVSCQTPTLTQQSTGRSWTPVRSEIGLDYNADEPETCIVDETGPYELVVPFVVPDDVEGPFWVDVWPADVGGTFVRFSIDP